MKKFYKIIICFLLVFCSLSIFVACKKEEKNTKIAWLIQETNPTNQTEAENGDMFLNSSTFEIYKKTNEGWIYVGCLKDSAPIVPNDGEDGKSAFEIAVENGFTGTEQEWLESLESPTWHVESFPPNDSMESKVGDLYLDSTTFNIFKKGTSNWILLGNIKGSSPKIEINSNGLWVIDGKETQVVADWSKVLVVGKIKAYDYLEKESFSDKKITIIGDSITAGAGTSDKKTKSYCSILSSLLGATVENLGINGTTFCEGLIGSDFSSATSRYEDVKNYDDETDYFIVQLGVNDWIRSISSNLKMGSIGSYDLNTICGALNVYAKTLKQKFEGTNTQIIFLTPTITRVLVGSFDSNTKNKLGYSLRDICNAIIETASIYEIKVIDLNIDSGIYWSSSTDNNVDQYLNSDGLHPNDEGHVLIAQVIANNLQENTKLVEKSKTKTLSLGFWSDGESKMKYQNVSVVTYGKYKLPNIFIERSGYTFACWKDEDGNEYQVGDLVTVSKNIKIDAQYIKNVTVVVNNFCGEETSSSTVQIKFKKNDENGLFQSYPISSILSNSNYGLTPTVYFDSAKTEKMDLDTKFSEGENVTIYVDWETDITWFKVENGVIVSKGENFPVYDKNNLIEIPKIIFPKYDANGETITSINSNDFFFSGVTALVLKNTSYIYFPEGYESILGNFFFTAAGATIDSRVLISKTIYFPSTLTNINTNAFANINVGKFVIHEDNSFFATNDHGMWLNKAKTQLIRYVDVYENNIVSDSFTILDGVTSFAGFTFYANKNLKTLKLTKELNTVVSGNDFAFMSNLETIVVEKNLSLNGTSGSNLLVANSFSQMSDFVRKGTIFVVDEDDKVYLQSVLGASTTTAVLSERICISSN